MGGGGGGGGEGEGEGEEHWQKQSPLVAILVNK